MKTHPMTAKERIDNWLAIPGNRERKAAKDKQYRDKNKLRILEREQSPEYRKARAARIRADRAANPDKYRCAEKAYARKHGVLSRNDAWAKKLKPVLHSAESREKARQTHKDKKETHPAARFWSLKSPDGVVYKFTNLIAFVESHMNLFTDHQSELVSCKNGRPIPRAARGLGMLSPRRKHPSETMYGWRWHIDGKHDETLLDLTP